MPAVSCRVLGPVRITVAGADAPAELLWRKHVALLVYLARSPRRSRTREHLVGLLWSDRDEKQARHSLSEALRVLRRTLGDASVRADVDQVGLTPDAVLLDCDRFAELCARGDWTEATALVDGEFLEGLSVPEAIEFESWLGAERLLWRTRTLEALERRAAAQLELGDAPAAAQTALRAVVLDRASEAAARTAMRALALSGDRAGALRVAEDLARTLRATLGAEPSAETVRLGERIREARIGRRVIGAPPPPAARARAPLVGRTAELAELTSAWRRAQAGRGQVVIVEGEPGEGKTRLLDELLGRARLDDATVAATRAVPQDASVPWGALAGLLASGLAEAPGLAAAPPEALAALAQIDPDLGVRYRPAGIPIATGDALGAAVRAVSAERPLLLAVDDAQWLDAQTLTTLPALARDVASRPVLLLLGIARGSPAVERLDSLRSRLGRELEGGVVRLGRLDADALRELVRWALPQYGADDLERLTRRLETDTAGIPLLAVAMLEAVVRGFTLPSAPGPAPGAGAWPSPKRTLIDSLPSELPPSVIGVICQRFRDLPEPAQRVLAAAAALGERSSAGRLARATALERGVVDEALELLEWNRWLVADGRGFVFAAPIERAVLLQEMITPGQARRYRGAPSP
jgi:DNA-binding SARP family transcriptional activator